MEFQFKLQIYSSEASYFLLPFLSNHNLTAKISDGVVVPAFLIFILDNLSLFLLYFIFIAKTSLFVSPG